MPQTEPKIEIKEIVNPLSPIQVTYITRIAGKARGIPLAEQAAQFRVHALSGKRFLVAFAKMGQGQKMPLGFVMFSEQKNYLKLHEILSASGFFATSVKSQLLEHAAEIARSANKQLIGLKKGVSTASLIAAAKKRVAANSRERQTPKAPKKLFRRIK